MVFESILGLASSPSKVNSEFSLRNCAKKKSNTVYKPQDSRILASLLWRCEEEIKFNEDEESSTKRGCWGSGVGCKSMKNSVENSTAFSDKITKKGKKFGLFSDHVFTVVTERPHAPEWRLSSCNKTSLFKIFWYLLRSCAKRQASRVFKGPTGNLFSYSTDNVPVWKQFERKIFRLKVKAGKTT